MSRKKQETTPNAARRSRGRPGKASEAKPEPLTFNLVNLGCPKNLVDSERIMGALAVDGFVYQEDPGEADVCIVNTCGFLGEARDEAREVLRELKTLRGKGDRPRIVALGCLVERVGGNPGLSEFLAPADAAVGFADYHRLPEICRSLCAGGGAARAGVTGARGYGGRTLPESYVRWLNGPAWRFSSPVTAWLKLGEGCSNHCAYCSIPLIRGDRVSRPESDVLHDARQLIDSGVREICLCAQDTTAYGMDREGDKGRFTDLLGRLLELEGDVYWRVLYAHPLHLTKELLRLMASNPRVCPYIDLPLQHLDSGVLGAMQRGYSFEYARRRLTWIRDIMPEAAIRTTFIVGHPGEGEEEFERLRVFVKEGRFDHVGVFAWSPEPGTRSARLQLETARPAEAERRKKSLMRAQAEVAHQKWKKRLGLVTPVFLEAPVPKCHGGSTWTAHTLWQAPDGIDGDCFVKGYPVDAAPTVLQARITEVEPHGCTAEIVE